MAAPDMHVRLPARGEGEAAGAREGEGLEQDTLAGTAVGGVGAGHEAGVHLADHFGMPGGCLQERARAQQHIRGIGPRRAVGAGRALLG